MADTNFNNLIDDIYNSLNEVSESVNVLNINNKRQIIPDSNFDTVIAYEGDINSQVITIKCIRLYDGHNLSMCDHKELRWKNLRSGVEGISVLSAEPVETGETFDLTWEVPSDACTQSGTIEISVSIYDKKDGHIVYSWNTSSYTGLSVGKSIDSVGLVFPPKDEILVVDKDTKSIIAPKGYNNIICNYGEIGMGEVYFLVNRYIGRSREIDLMDISTKVCIHYIIDNKLQYVDDNTTSQVTVQLYTAEIANRNNEGLVFVKWIIPDFVTSGAKRPDNIKIMLSISADKKTWCSNVYPSLKIGENIFQITVVDPDQPDSFSKQVKEVIDEYLFENDFIINCN